MSEKSSMVENKTTFSKEKVYSFFNNVVEGIQKEIEVETNTLKYLEKKAQLEIVLNVARTFQTNEKALEE